jgi:DNA-binding response OmpR family regulator
MSTVLHDKKLILDAGADLYMPKPYELVNVFNWVETLLKEYNSV